MRPHRLDSKKHGGLHTSGDNSTSVRARVEQALRELPLSEDDIATRAPQIAEGIGQLRGGRISTDSLFFDFRGKVTAIVQHFASDGLTLADYLRVTGKKPDLFAQSPATIRANVEGAVQRFAAQGLTRRNYLRAALRQPQLLQLAPATVEANLAGVVKRFRKHGLTRQDYLRAALRQTSLFTMSAGTVIAHVEAVVHHFRKHGLTLSDYVRAARKQPTLFYQSPATIQRNIEEVVGHFKAQGLTLPDYLRAAVRQPSVFTQAPATIRANVEAVAARFGPHGLTLPDYLRAVLRQPSLLGLSADRVFAQAEAVTAHFRTHGLTLEGYLQAVLRQPSLLAQSPATLINNIECVVAHFRQHELTLHDYLRAAARRPQLFHQSPATIQRNIEEVVGHFKAQGLTLSDYLRAAIRQPSLFYQSPATIIRHIYFVINMRTQGLVTFREEQNPGDGSPLRPLFGFLVKGPQYFCLSDDNYALRTEYARVTGDRPRGTALLTRPRSRIEQDLAAALSQDSPARSGRSVMRSDATAFNPQAGFSLIMVSILLTVAALVFVSVLPGEQSGDYNQKTTNNLKKLEKVEESMRSFMALNGRRPCPADGQYAPGSQNFGVEADSGGLTSGVSCVNGAAASGLPIGSGGIIAPLGRDAGTGHVVGGVIPTKNLGLDDSYAFDEFGRLFTYVVDTRATTSVAQAIGASSTNYCTYLQNSIKYNGIVKGPTPSDATTTPAILIESSTGGTVLDQTMYAYISHGPSGYGAYPAQGAATPAGRINTGNTDADKATNAGVSADGLATYSTANFTNVKVKKDKTATFDDFVYYRQDLKNTCCLGASCIPVGFAAYDDISGDEYSGYSVAAGDVNGDGIPDLIIGAHFGSSNANSSGSTFVVFGSRLGFPDPLPLSTLNGTNGFRIDGTTALMYAGSAVATGDVNGDGIADIIIGANNATVGANAIAGKTFVVFGRTSWARSSYTLDNNGVSGVIDGTHGIELDGAAANSYSGWSVATGDVNGDGYADVVIGAKGAAPHGANSGSTYVVFGNTTLGSTIPTVASGTVTFVANPSNGLTITLNGQAWTFTTGAPGANKTVIKGTLALTLTQLASDLNASATSTISVATYSASATVLTVTYKTAGVIGNTYTLNKGTAGSAVSAATLTGGAGTPYTLNAAFLNGTNGVQFDGAAASNFSGYSVGTGDVNGDGYADVIIGAYGATVGANVNAGKTYVVFGKSGVWASPTALSGLNGTTGVEFDGASANDESGFSVAAGDINGDGYADVIIGAFDASPGGVVRAGSTYVVFGSATGGVPVTTITTVNGKGTIASGTALSVGSTTGLVVGQTIIAVGIPAATTITAVGAGTINTSANATASAMVAMAVAATPLSALNGTTGFRIDGIASQDEIGFAVASGDINGDGYADVIIGSMWVIPAGLGIQTGATYVVFGKTGSWTNPTLLSGLNGTNGSEFDGYQTNDQDGRTVAAGDINGDGIADLISSSSGADSLAGATYVYFGHKNNAPNPWPTTPYQLGTLVGGGMVARLAFQAQKPHRLARPPTTTSAGCDGYGRVAQEPYTYPDRLHPARDVDRACDHRRDHGGRHVDGQLDDPVGPDRQHQQEARCH